MYVTKVILVGLLLPSIIYAHTLTAKNSNMSMKMNDQLLLIKKDETITVSDGTLCYISGDGRLIINNKKQFTKISFKRKKDACINLSNQKIPKKKTEESNTVFTLEENDEKLHHGTSFISSNRLENIKDERRKLLNSFYSKEKRHRTLSFSKNPNTEDNNKSISTKFDF